MIVLVGPGRCGSSYASRLLIGLGVNMGDVFAPVSRASPNGTWEDLEFKIPNDLLLRGLILKQQWRDMVVAAINRRKGLWGFKDPRTCHFRRLYKELLPDATWIRVHRDRDSVIESMCRVYGWMHGRAAQLVDYREAAIKDIDSVLEFDDIDSWEGQLRDMVYGSGSNQSYIDQRSAG